MQLRTAKPLQMVLHAAACLAFDQPKRGTCQPATHRTTPATRGLSESNSSRSGSAPST